MKTLLLVEDFDLARFLELSAFSMDTHVVALRPMAMYHLDQAGFPYSILEDYMIWSDGKDSNFEVKFFNFINGIENIIQEKYPDTKSYTLPLTYHTITIFRFLVESFLQKMVPFIKMLEVEEPSLITYLGKEKVSAIDDDLYNKTNSLYYEIMMSINNGIAKRFCYVDGSVDKESIKKSYKDSKLIRNVWNYCRTNQFIPAYKKLHLCFANVIPDKIREAKRNGVKVSMLPEFVSDVDPGFLNESHNMLINESCWLLSKDFDVLPECVHRVIGRRLRYFLNFMVPKTVYLVRRYKEYFKDNSTIDYVCFNRRNSIHRYSASIAAKQLGIKTIYFRHGWDMIDSWERKYTRLLPFDYYCDPGKHTANHYSKPCQVPEEASSFWGESVHVF